ncbi:MAG: transposase, partial [Flavobacteriaceae bacterium]|nr:transposase [Flavobacteriaceae bacterium]
MGELKEQEYIDKLIISDNKISKLESENATLRRMIFGPKSEKFITEVDVTQGKLFDDSETLSEPATQEKPETITIEKHTKTKPKRKPLEITIPDNIERRTEIVEPENKQEDFKQIGEEVTEFLEVEPAKIYVRIIVRPKYVTPQGTIVIADKLEMVLPRSNAGTSVLVKLITDKFADHLPFHRQLKIFKREGVIIAESTYNGWFTKASKILEPLYQTLVEQTVNTDYVKADESPIPVQTRDKKGSTHRGYQWVYQNPIKNIV